MFIPSKPSQPSLMYVGEEHFRCSALGHSPDLTKNHKIRMYRPARYKQSRLIEHFKITGVKIIITLGPELLGEV